MEKPIQLLILDELEARLKNMKTGNGYQRTLATAKRSTLNGFQSADLPAANLFPGNEDVTGRGASFVDRRLSISVEAYDLTRDRPFADVAFEIAGDVIAALHRATTAPGVADNPEHKLGGLVTSLQLVSITPLIGEGQAPWCGALINFAALYRTKSDDITLASP